MSINYSKSYSIICMAESHEINLAPELCAMLRSDVYDFEVSCLIGNKFNKTEFIHCIDSLSLAEFDSRLLVYISGNVLLKTENMYFFQFSDDNSLGGVETTMPFNEVLQKLMTVSSKHVGIICDVEIDVNTISPVMQSFLIPPDIWTASERRAYQLILPIHKGKKKLIYELVKKLNIKDKTEPISFFDMWYGWPSDSKPWYFYLNGSEGGNLMI